MKQQDLQKTDNGTFGMAAGEDRPAKQQDVPEESGSRPGKPSAADDEEV